MADFQDNLVAGLTAIRENNVQGLAALLKETGVGANSKVQVGEYSMTEAALLQAIHAGQTGPLRTVLENGANPNDPSLFYGMGVGSFEKDETPSLLDIAADAGKGEVVQLLKEFGAKTSAELAAQEDHVVPNKVDLGTAKVVDTSHAVKLGEKAASKG